MRILRAVNVFPQVNFAGRDRTANKSGFLVLNGNTYASDAIFSQLQSEATINSAAVQPYKRYALNMDEILRAKSPETETKKPVPFEEGHGKFIMDKYQTEAVDAFNSGKTTIVAAPTGTGKTLIAEHAINEALKSGKKIIYLSPLKALSNEKYTDFAKMFGNYDENGNLIDTDNVGLLTGDNSINPYAPVLVMTTEVYKNSLLSCDEAAAQEKYKDYVGVIYDEFHYLGDCDRGTVWEESVMYTPEHMKQMMLSATASNAEEIQKWVSTINPNIDTHLVNVPESGRYVPLKELVMIKNSDDKYVFDETKVSKIDIRKIEQQINLSERQYETLRELKELTGFDDKGFVSYLKTLSKQTNEVNSSFLSKNLQDNYGIEPTKADAISLILSNKNSTTYKKAIPQNCDFIDNVKPAKLVSALNASQMTPALIYIFSKKECNRALESTTKNIPSLLTPEESKMVYEEVQKCKENGVFLGEDFDETVYEGLLKGVAVHHAGKLPAYKSLIENLARKGLIKACFATETLIAGINMPFKTTVFSSFQKFDGEQMSDISNATFKQGAGRAGRRGKDDIGNVVIIPAGYEDFEKYTKYSSSKNTSIRSRYTPSYASCLSERMINNKDEALLKSLIMQQSSDRFDKLIDDMENKFKLLESYGYIENENGTLKRTESGDIASKVYGINEIFMTELLTNPNYLKDFTSQELIVLCASFADVKDETPSRDFKNGLKYVQEKLNPIFDMAEDVNRFEEYYQIDTKPIQFSTNLAPFILDFANAEPDRESSIKSWSSNVEKMKTRELLFHEGDFLRVINSTIDILKLIAELSPDKNIRQEASIAIDKLRKPPIGDIFNYELNLNM